MSLGFTPDLITNSSKTFAPISAGCQPDKEPFFLPPGVLTAETIYAFCAIKNPHQKYLIGISVSRNSYFVDFALLAIKASRISVKRLSLILAFSFRNMLALTLP